MSALEGSWSTQELGFKALGPGGIGTVEWMTHALSVPSALFLFHGSLPVPVRAGCYVFRNLKAGY